MQPRDVPACFVARGKGGEREGGTNLCDLCYCNELGSEGGIAESQKGAWAQVGEEDRELESC